MKLSDAARDAACNSIVDLIDVSSPGHLYIRTGTTPTNTTDGDTGTLLATFTFASTAFGSSSAGVATANSISSVTIAATGTAAHFRIKDGAGTVIMQGNCGTSSADIVWNSTSFVSGGTASITSLTVTVLAGS